MNKVLFILLVYVFTSVCDATLFAANRTFNYGGDPLRVGYEVGELDITSGNFVQLGTALVLQAGGFIYSQASAFDQSNQIFYFYGSGPYIYGYNVAANQVLPPVYFSSLLLVNFLTWTSFNNQLYIYGSTSHGNDVIYSYPSNGPSTLLVNLTSVGLPPYAQIVITADPIKGTGYVIFNKDTNNGLINLVTFTPAGTVNVTLLGCKIQFFTTTRIFYDPVALKLVGVGQAGVTTIYFEQNSDGVCNYKSFNGGYTIDDVAYDPTTSTIYVYGSYDGKTSYLYKWVTTSTSSTVIPVIPDLVNLVVSYKL